MSFEIRLRQRICCKLVRPGFFHSTTSYLLCARIHSFHGILLFYIHYKMRITNLFSCVNLRLKVIFSLLFTLRKGKWNRYRLFYILSRFVYLFIATQAIFQLSGGCHHYRWQGCIFRPMLGTQGLRAGRDLYSATPTATRGLGLHGLIWTTVTHVPQWGSKPRRKDLQIFAPDALPTAPRRRLILSR
jgi:hypothetical protein